MDDAFYTGYRKNILKSEEILQSILIPYTGEVEEKHVYTSVCILSVEYCVLLNEVYLLRLFCIGRILLGLQASQETRR
jgi:hypothetical protein